MKNFKMKVTKAESAYVQQACFDRGIYWCGGSKDIMTVAPYLFIEHDVIVYNNDTSHFDARDLKEITFLDFIELTNKAVKLSGVSLLIKDIEEVMYFGMMVRIPKSVRAGRHGRYLATDADGCIRLYTIEPIWEDGEWCGCESWGNPGLDVAECREVVNPELSLMEI